MCVFWQPSHWLQWRHDGGGSSDAAAAVSLLLSWQRQLCNWLAERLAMRNEYSSSKSLLPTKGAKGTLPFRVDITIIGWIHEAIISVTVVRMIASCVHCITHARRAGSMDQRTLCWRRVGWPVVVSVCMAARGAKQNGRTERSASDDCRGRCAGGTSVKSLETDWENGYENRSQLFSYEWSLTVKVCGFHCIVCLSTVCDLLTRPTIIPEITAILRPAFRQAKCPSA